MAGRNPHLTAAYGDGRGPAPTQVAADQLVQRLLSAWQQGPPQLASLLEQAERQQPQELRELLLTDADQRRQRGLRISAAEYFAELPELRHCQWAWELLAAERDDCRRRGEPSPDASQQAKFPELWQRLLRELGSPEPVVSQPLEPAPEAAPLFGDFEVRAELGAGAYGQVLLCRQLSLDRYVALKLTSPGGNEGRALARMHHPHIVAIYDERVQDGCKALAMQYVAGANLAQWIDIRQTLSTDVQRRWTSQQLLRWLERTTTHAECDVARRSEPLDNGLSLVCCAVQIVRDVTLAIQHAHQHGVLHRDIKPANILLARDGRALLTDFGVAAWRERREQREQDSGASLGGTVSYMAPEHLQALRSWSDEGGDVDVRSDLYSLGVVFYELLCGRHPWPDGESIGQCLQQRSEGPPAALVASGCTASLAAIVEKLLMPRPADRYQSAGELLEDLDRWLAGRGPRHAPDRSWGERGRRWLNRNGRRVVAATLLLLAAAGVWTRRVTGESQRITSAQLAVERAGQQLAEDQIKSASRSLGHAEGLLTGQPSWDVASCTWTARRRAVAALQQTRRELGLAELRQAEQTLAATRLGPQPGTVSADAAGIHLQAWLDESAGLPAPNFRQQLPAAKRQALAEAVAELLVWRLLDAERRGDPEAARQCRRRLQALPDAVRSSSLLSALAAGKSPQSLPLPESGDEFSLYLAGVLAAARGDPQRAATLLRASHAARAAPTPRFWTRFTLAHCCQLTNQLTEAAALYGECVGLRPDVIAARYNLALVLAAQKNWAAARQQLQDVLHREPNFAPAIADLGAIALQLEEPQQALRQLNRAIELGHRSHQAYANRASARRQLMDHAGADEDLRKALQLAPHQPALNRQRDNLQRQTGLQEPDA